ncbi:MAG: diguanylate cyclase [Anaerolineae bacterium]|nr:diguanylate cyclase [Anaerolineae bacterium]
MAQTILLVEDSPGDALLIKEAISGADNDSFILEWADTLAGALECLKIWPIDAVLLDLSLPDGFGFQTVSQMLQAAPHLPIIILTGLEDETLAVRAVQLGAQDYLVKGQVNQASLLRSIRYAIERKQQEENLRTSEARFRLLADNITDVVFTTTLDLTITSVTPSATHLLNYKPEEIVGRPMQQFLTPDSFERLKLMLEEECEGDCSPQRDPFWSRREEMEYVCKKGNTVWTEAKFSFLPDRGEKNGGLLAVVRDITERRYWEETLKQANDALRVLATRDPLTGLFNRRYMEETLERELHRAERESYLIGMIMFDIDHFKDFNDQYGHVGGDLILRELGILLKKHTRNSDVVCRYGGEEFIIVLPKASSQLTLERAEQIRKLVKNLSIIHNGQRLDSLSISAGIAIYPEHGIEVDSLVMAADAALYRAKAEGRDCVMMAAPVKVK